MRRSVDNCPCIANGGKRDTWFPDGEPAAAPVPLRDKGALMWIMPQSRELVRVEYGGEHGPVAVDVGLYWVQMGPGREQFRFICPKCGTRRMRLYIWQHELGCRGEDCLNLYHESRGAQRDEARLERYRQRMLKTAHDYRHAKRAKSVHLRRWMIARCVYLEERQRQQEQLWGKLEGWWERHRAKRAEAEQQAVDRQIAREAREKQRRGDDSASAAAG